MIDFGKLQANIVKDLVKARLKHKKPDYRIYKTDLIEGAEYVPVVYKGVSVFLIPLDLCMLDPEIQERGPGPVEEFFKHMGEETEELTDTGTVKQYGKEMLKVFVDKEGELIFVNTQLLGPFGKDNLFRKSRNRAAVYVVNASGVEGLVCTVRVPKQEAEKARGEIEQVCKASPG